MKKLLSLLLTGSIALCLASKTYGHAISIGYENAGAGSVNIWLGTYAHGGHHLEGSLNLVGVAGNPFPSTTVPFSMLVGAGTPAGGGKPAGLVDGVNNFFAQWNGIVPNNLPLANDQSSWLAFSPTSPVNHWQGVNFTGLLPGSYQFTYIPIANPTAEWDLLSVNMNGIFDLTGVINPPAGVPDGGSSLLMLGLALCGIVGIRRSVATRKN